MSSDALDKWSLLTAKFFSVRGAKDDIWQFNLFGTKGDTSVFRMPQYFWNLYPETSRRRANRYSQVPEISLTRLWKTGDTEMDKAWRLRQLVAKHPYLVSRYVILLSSGA